MMLWVVLPAYNECESLPRLLPRLDEALRAEGIAYRLVVVDDGSDDVTPSVLSGFAGRLPMEVVTHWFNRGLGETERDGLEHVAVRCEPDDIIVRLEGDDTHDPAYLLHLVRKLAEGYDVVSTSRFRPGGGQIGVSRYRATISRGANLFMKALFRIPGVRDYSCGYRAYRASVIQDALRIYGNLFIQLKGLGFTSTLEILVKLHLLGCRFVEVPFVLRYDRKPGASKMVTNVTTLGYVVMAILYYWPFGGWLSRYRGLAHLYRQNRDLAIERFGRGRLPRQSASGISL
jgi:dolichol-phosphate mannosyltransferase